MLKHVIGTSMIYIYIVHTSGQLEIICYLHFNANEELMKRYGTVYMEVVHGHKLTQSALLKPYLCRVHTLHAHDSFYVFCCTADRRISAAESRLMVRGGQRHPETTNQKTFCGFKIHLEPRILFESL